MAIQADSQQNLKEKLCAQFLVAQTVYDSYRKTVQSVSGIADKRVKLIEHSLATWMLRVADVITHPPSHPDPSQWRNFRVRVHFQEPAKEIAAGAREGKWDT